MLGEQAVRSEKLQVRSSPALLICQPAGAENRHISGRDARRRAPNPAYPADRERHLAGIWLRAAPRIGPDGHPKWLVVQKVERHFAVGEVDAEVGAYLH